jgi:carboxyl-terminal processing protease
LRKTLTEIKEERLAGLILDLRNNPGGLLDESVSTASQFSKAGNVLIIKDAEGRERPVPVGGKGLGLDIPMVVLVNQGTVSAAEILAGALQDAHRATLVGEKTFGTGTVLQEFPLSDGSALLLATEEWLRPNGRAIWHKGITPNMEVSLSQECFPCFLKRNKV